MEVLSSKDSTFNYANNNSLFPAFNDPAVISTISVGKCNSQPIMYFQCMSMIFTNALSSQGKLHNRCLTSEANNRK